MRIRSRASHLLAAFGAAALIVTLSAAPATAETEPAKRPSPDQAAAATDPSDQRVSGSARFNLSSGSHANVRICVNLATDTRCASNDSRPTLYRGGRIGPDVDAVYCGEGYHLYARYQADDYRTRYDCWGSGLPAPGNTGGARLIKLSGCWPVWCDIYLQVYRD